MSSKRKSHSAEFKAKVALEASGWPIRKVNHKRVARLMRLMGLAAIYPKPKTSISSKEHQKYPYLLRGLAIVEPNQVWCTDVTYIRLHAGFVYLTAIMDWYSRYVLAWRLSNTMDTGFCLEALHEALDMSKPEIFNSDQGSQFTSLEFTKVLTSRHIRISMDGKGRCSARRDLCGGCPVMGIPTATILDLWVMHS